MIQSVLSSSYICEMEKFLLFSGVGRKKDQLVNWDVDLKRQKIKGGLGEVTMVQKTKKKKKNLIPISLRGILPRTSN